ncbi:MAG: type III secretion system export apparatus subunit SctU [Parachlamydiales bacterium]|jgi:type III secretion protein U
MGEKTEKATPKKLRDARKKGQVAKIQDLPSAITFVTAIMGTLMAASFLFKHLGGYILKTFHSISGQIDMMHKAGGYLTEAIEVIAICSLPIMVVVSLVGIIVSFLVVGPVFSFEAMKFQFKRLNPIEGIKQKFKVKVLVDLLKSIAKISGAALIIYLIIRRTLPEVVQTSSIPIEESADLFGTFLKQSAIQVGIFFLIIALFDLAFQKRTFAKEMMMEKFEIRQEYRDTEGDPHIKGRRREMFREIAYTEGPRAARRAKAVVINPTHIAVAVGYEQNREKVPVILTMGIGKMAEQIIGVANQANIPIMRNVDLARTLFAKGKIGDFIPLETYKAIAEILKWLETLEKRTKEGVAWELPK